MKKFAVVVAVVCVSTFALVYGCTPNGRHEAIERASKAVAVLNGADKSVEQEHATPLVVQEQQRKEIIRQNTEWTAENQALHPIEYCQAQLRKLDDYARKMQVAAHKLAVEESRIQRSIEENSEQMTALENFLAKAKSKYKEAETAGNWPMELNGFKLSREVAQEKIIEADAKLRLLKAQETKPQNNLASIRKRQTAVTQEQSRIVATREMVQRTIHDLRTKQVMEGENGIIDALKALNDELAALSSDADKPELADIMTPDEKSDREIRFNEIMNN